MQFGRYYEQFEVGAVYKHWPGKTVTEYDDHLFCLLTMNHHPLHLDVNYAEKTTDFGKNVVVGLNAYIPMLILGLLARFTNDVVLPHGSTRYNLHTSTAGGNISDGTVPVDSLSPNVITATTGGGDITVTEAS